MSKQEDAGTPGKARLHRLSLEPKRLLKRYMVCTPAPIMQALAEKSGRT